MSRTRSIKAINASFSAFKLEHSTKCRYDSLSVYDGASNDSILIGKFCGSLNSSSGPGTRLFLTGGNSLFLLFTSDGSAQHEGFTFGWKSMKSARRPRRFRGCRGVGLSCSLRRAAHVRQWRPPVAALSERLREGRALRLDTRHGAQQPLQAHGRGAEPAHARRQLHRRLRRGGWRALRSPTTRRASQIRDGAKTDDRSLLKRCVSGSGLGADNVVYTSVPFVLVNLRSVASGLAVPAGQTFGFRISYEAIPSTATASSSQLLSTLPFQWTHSAVVSSTTTRALSSLRTSAKATTSITSSATGSLAGRTPPPCILSS